MNATSLYVSASRLLFQLETSNPNYTDLYRLVPYLRQSLSCTVCANLLVEPYSPQDVCQHHVCRGCIGGRKNLKPTCLSCKNYQSYQPNSQLRILLQCYKNLCKYVLSTPVVYGSMNKYVHVDAASNGGTEAHNLAELIDEGAQFNDEYKSNAGLTKSAFSILPFIFSSTAASTSSSHTVSTVTTPSTPLTSTTNVTRVAIATIPSPSPTIGTPAKIETPTFIRTVSHAPIISSANCMVSVSSSIPHKGETITLMTSPNLLKSPAIKTVSNGAAMYSVLYSGAGNKITIKRKPDDMNTTLTSTATLLQSPTTTSVLVAAPTPIITTTAALATSLGLTPTMSTALANSFSTSNMINVLSMNPPKIQQLPHIQHHQPQPQISLQQVQPIVGHQFQIQPQQVPGLITQTQNFKKPIILKPAIQKPIQKRKGCRCGNATPTPGKLTCCGQRCPCYVESKSCVDCKCRGCRNPHRIDGQKVRPQIPVTCLVQVNTAPNVEKTYIQSFAPVTGPIIKQEINSPQITNLLPINNCQIMPGTLNSSMNLQTSTPINLQPSNDSIEFLPNELDDGNIQVLNVYTTHMPEMSNTLPTIIMQDDSSLLNATATNSNFTLQKHLTLPPNTFSLISEDLIKHSYSDDGSSDESDIEIDL